MRIVKIPKRQGAYRTLYLPSRREREAIRRLLPALRTQAQTSLAILKSSMAFSRAAAP